MFWQDDEEDDDDEADEEHEAKGAHKKGGSTKGLKGGEVCWHLVWTCSCM